MSLEEKIREVLANYSCTYCGHSLTSSQNRRSLSLQATPTGKAEQGVQVETPIIRGKLKKETLLQKKGKDSVKIEHPQGDLDNKTARSATESAIEPKVQSTASQSSISGIVIPISVGNTVISHGNTPRNYKNALKNSKWLISANSSANTSEKVFIEKDAAKDSKMPGKKTLSSKSKSTNYIKTPIKQSLWNSKKIVISKSNASSPRASKEVFKNERSPKFIDLKIQDLFSEIDKTDEENNWIDIIENSKPKTSKSQKIDIKAGNRVKKEFSYKTKREPIVIKAQILKGSNPSFIVTSPINNRVPLKSKPQKLDLSKPTLNDLLDLV
ncbi:unnamed protein product [Blepharisma stoltei]|uniref:Uncharacterized protein n=1 Tax=Blepharisma stoltei TaxID=1481888 RepID=A0AAU9KG22_9CILI|nr:unnamed protein product [Blepharisma stoltei]